MSILKGVELFSGIPEQDLTDIAAMGTTHTYAKGDLLFAEGSKGKELHIVTRGSIAINKNVAGGRKRNLANLHAGDVFGEVSLYDEEPRSADAVVTEEAEVVMLPNETFLSLLKERPALGLAVQTRIIKLLCRRLRDTNDMLKEGVIWGFKMDM